MIDASTSWEDQVPKGWKYRDRAGEEDGVRKIKLKPSDTDGKAKTQVVGKGSTPQWPAPIANDKFFDQDSTVTVQLLNADGTCWTSEFAAADTKRNTGSLFKARSR